MGRVMRFLSLPFTRIDGIDVSPRMVAKAAVYRLAVFQHLPDTELIRGYVHEAFRVLRPGGWLKFTVQTADGPNSPDRVDTWYGVDVSRDDVESWCAESGLRLIDAYSRDAYTAWVVLRKPPSVYRSTPAAEMRQTPAGARGS